jgi:capsule polysaccharide modification protein KpsS
MHLENWIYRVLYGKACTGKISKQQVQKAITANRTDGLSGSDSRQMGVKVCGLACKTVHGFFTVVCDGE